MNGPADRLTADQWHTIAELGTDLATGRTSAEADRAWSALVDGTARTPDDVHALTQFVLREASTEEGDKLESITNRVESIDEHRKSLRECPANLRDARDAFEIELELRL